VTSTWISQIESVAQARCESAEPAHDWLHVKRVVANAQDIAVSEGGIVEVATAAALLHELFNYPKGHPESRRSGERCAEEARIVLTNEGCPSHLVEPICYAIAVHPFSLGVNPETLEAKVLQDADRLDALGAIGIARCFATCADMKRPFYSAIDPMCRDREPADKLWGVDHFFQKLLKLPDVLHTRRAKALAERRLGLMHAFLAQLADEIAASSPT